LDVENILHSFWQQATFGPIAGGLTIAARAREQHR
jgi:hypothetical protein